MLRALYDGNGGMLLVSGEAGIGKTALVENLMLQADERGASILTGACYDLPPTAPCALWLDILEGLGSEGTSVQTLIRAIHELAGDAPGLVILEYLH